MLLTPSERVTVIKNIGARLVNEDYPLIDITLKQFGLPWSDQWTGSKHAYVLQAIEHASDNVLIDLARHVGFQMPATAPRIEPPFWRKGMLKVFVSHLATHRKFAADLQEALSAFGISGFVAHNDIEPTQEWQTEIETALATCDALVALLHPNFHKSNWTDQEIGFAMGRGIPVFSIRFGEDPYGFIGRFQAFESSGKTPGVLARELFEAYRKSKQTQERIGEVLVELFEESASFAIAKNNLAYLEELESWGPSFSARIQAAVKSNSQVADAWGVPSRVDALVKKWAKSGA